MVIDFEGIKADQSAAAGMLESTIHQFQALASLLECRAAPLNTERQAELASLMHLIAGAAIYAFESCDPHRVLEQSDQLASNRPYCDANVS